MSQSLTRRGSLGAFYFLNFGDDDLSASYFFAFGAPYSCELGGYDFSAFYLFVFGAFYFFTLGDADFGTFSLFTFGARRRGWGAPRSAMVPRMHRTAALGRRRRRRDHRAGR